MVNRLLEGLFPTFCSLCGLRSHRQRPLCHSCQTGLAANDHYCDLCALPLPAVSAPGQPRTCGSCLASPPPFSRVVAPWLYDESMAFLMRRWKFQGERHLTALLAELWLDGGPEYTPVDIIVPVPLHWWRLCQRGFNQSELLSRNLMNRCPSLDRASLAKGLVSRDRATRSQSSLTASNRHRNLHGVFTVHRPCDNQRIAIVDDVMTTGATVTALTNSLMAAGAKSVEGWCVARTPAPPN